VYHRILNNKEFVREGEVNKVVKNEISTKILSENLIQNAKFGEETESANKVEYSLCLVKGHGTNTRKAVAL
jgi:hypothetical protein